MSLTLFSPFTNNITFNLKSLQCHNGGEFQNKCFAAFFTHGIVHWFLCPYTSAKNGHTERMIHTIMIMLFFPIPGSLPHSYLAEVLSVSTSSQYLTHQNTPPPYPSRALTPLASFILSHSCLRLSMLSECVYHRPSRALTPVARFPSSSLAMPLFTKGSIVLIHHQLPPTSLCRGRCPPSLC